MKKTNKCILIVTDRGARFRDSHRFCCYDVFGSCKYFEDGIASKEFEPMEPACRFIGKLRNDGTIPCRCKDAQDDLLKVWVSGDAKCPHPERLGFYTLSNSTGKLHCEIKWDESKGIYYGIISDNDTRSDFSHPSDWKGLADHWVKQPEWKPRSKRTNIGWNPYDL